MDELVRDAGSFALVVTPFALLASAFLSPADIPVDVTTLEGGIVLVGGVTTVVRRDRGFGDANLPGFSRSDVADWAAVLVASVATYLLSVQVGFGPVVASALVGLFVGVGKPEVAVQAYCGSFVGMASPALFPSVNYLLLAGTVAGLAYVATTEVFHGFGGKLGTLALFGCATTATFTDASYAAATLPQWSNAVVVVPVAILAAIATVVLSVRLELGAVVGSALVGLVAGVAFPLAFPAMGSTLATVAFCASFVGMSTTDRLGHEGHVALAGTLCGIVFVAVAPSFTGAGGKLGTVAFVSSLAEFGAVELVDSMGGSVVAWSR
ncbi:hypothetical protein [Haladaptatus sp.]|uniref:hypothetical protein n=1 Tax=Haladaptatus sp. TaxID=1973141 RepID=UPI003C446359